MQLSRSSGHSALSRESAAPPSYQAVQEFHTNADIDSSTAAIHHTEGSAQNQAAAGDHTHDGGSSAPLLPGVTISGARGSSAYYTSLEAALIRLGASSSATG